MSENLDLVRSIFADWERGDFSSAEWADSEIEWVAPDGPSPGRLLGVAAMTASWRGVLSAFRDFRPEAFFRFILRCKVSTKGPFFPSGKYSNCCSQR